MCHQRLVGAGTSPSTVNRQSLLLVMLEPHSYFGVWPTSFPGSRESLPLVGRRKTLGTRLVCDVLIFTVSTNNNVILRFCLTNPRKNPTCSLYISACAHIALWSRVSLQMRRSVVAGEKDLPALQGKYYRLVKVKLSVLITHERLYTGRLPWQSAFRARCFLWTETCFRPNWLRSRRMRFFAVFARVAVSSGVK